MRRRRVAFDVGVTSDATKRDLTQDAEAALVLSWRYDLLRRAGYRREDAFALARARVDVHAAAELLQRGCPAPTALEILL